MVCCLFGTLLPCYSYSQSDSSRELKTVLVRAFKFNQFQTGLFVQHLDSNTLQFKASQNLDQVLAQSSGIFIKSYGPSQISSSSSRGANAQQTAILWNGFNLANPMLGQQDLSLLPVFLIDEVSIQYGAQSGLYGSGNMGAGIHIQTNHKALPGFHLGIIGGMGSFGERNAGLKFSWAKKGFSLKQKLFIKKADNNFEYTNPLGFNERMNHAGNTGYSWLQDFSYQVNQYHSLKISTWFQRNERQIPAGFGTTDLEATQTDESKRISGEYHFQNKNYSLSYRGAYFNDLLDYKDNGDGLQRSLAEQFNQAIDQVYAGKSYRVLLSVQFQHLTGISKEYQQTRKRQIPALFFSIQKRFFQNKLELQATGRQEWNNSKAVPFIPSLGLNYQLLPSLSFNGNISKSYRIPSLNDLYWVPGGNINLLPETGLNNELGITIRTFKNKGPEIRLNGYQRNTENQITWIPVSSNRWEVQNIGNVLVNGVELHWNFRLKLKSVIIQINGQHDYCEALNRSKQNDPSYNKQIIYVPRVKHNMQLFVVYKTIGMNYVHQYIGQRFTSSTNSTALNEYMLGNISISKNIILKNQEFKLQISRLNCFGTSYMVVSNRPMPGAENQISIQYQF